MDWNQAFDEMRKLFWIRSKIAKEFVSPNIEDDIYIKHAIIGFSHESKTEQWGIDHYNFLKDRLQSSYPSRQEEFVPEIGLYSLILGYILGIHNSKRISDQEFLEAEYFLPGYILSFGEQLLPHRVR